jgi:rod shape-determining protein MreD
MTKRVLALAAVILAVLLVQTTLLGPVRLWGARPDLLLLAVVALAMTSGPLSGAHFGFWAGLAADLLLELPVGVSALVYTLTGYLVGVARVYLVSQSVLVPAAVAGVASLASVWLSGAVLRVLDYSEFSWEFVARTAPLVTLFNLLLAPVVYPLVSRVAERVVAEKVVRW